MPVGRVALRVRVSEGPDGGWSRHALECQVRIGIAITAVKVVTAAATHGHVFGSRK